LAASTSPTQLVVPENGIIVDYVQVAAPTAVGFNISLDSAAQPGANNINERLYQLIPKARKSTMYFGK
jgi:hypothetical protein